MKNKIKTKIGVLIPIIFLISGCSKVEPSSEINNEILLNRGAFVTESSGQYSVYNINDSGNIDYIDTNKIITEFVSNGGTYLFYRDDKLFINYKGKEIEFLEEKSDFFKLSPDGEVLFYFKKEGSLEPYIYLIKEDKKVHVGNNALISGKFIDWISNERLIYYGIESESKKAGIFSFNIKTGEEELIYHMKNGFIDFLEATKDGVVFLQEEINGVKILKAVDRENNVIEITDKIDDLKDVEFFNNQVYILGKIKDNVYSIYDVTDGNIKRLIYDFPTIINVNKGFSINENGEIFFIGSSDGPNDEKMYRYNDGSVSLFSDKSESYNFIQFN